MKKYPIYICIDTSNAMHGEAIEAVNAGLQEMLAKFRRDPYALESLLISIVAFDSQAQELLPLTDLINIQLPNIFCSKSNEASLGAALKHIEQQNLIASAINFKECERPAIFIFTNGMPADLPIYNEVLSKINSHKFLYTAVCVINRNANIPALA